MKGRSPLLTIAIALTGVLLIAIGMIALGQHESESFPSAHSYLPSGTAALEELFRRSGYTVVVDQKASPKLQPGDLAVAFYSVDSKNILAQIQDQENKDSEPAPDPLQPTKDALNSFVKDGGSLLSLPVAEDFAGNSKSFMNSVVTVQSPDGSKARVNWDGNPSGETFISDSDQHYALWADYSNPRTARELVSLHRVGKGSDAVVADGIIASNRFIDRNQNALVIMDTARVLAKPGARVVFVEAAFGNAEDPALTELIGPWAKAAWLQLVFLGIVAIYTLGKPFGLPDPERREQKGSRELLDAMADTLKRGRMTKLALRSVYDDTNRLLRKWFRTPRDTNRSDPEAQRLIDLHHSLNRVQAALEIGAPEDEAARMVRDVERLVKEVASSGSHPYRIGS
jgi:hypothetical protein